MLVNKFREIAEGLGWVFNYGIEDYQNLMDLVNDISSESPQKYFLLLYKEREKRFNDFNVLLAEIFTGEFLLVERSDFTEIDYNFKYQNHIEKMEAELDNYQIQIKDCEGWTVESWIETEVINSLDTNVDGIKVRFRIRHEI